MKLTSPVPAPASSDRPPLAPRPGSALIREGRVLVSDSIENRPRWREGERLEDVFEELCDRLRRSGQGHSAAVDGVTGRLTYEELDQRANQLARFLARSGELDPGARVSLLFDRAIDGYVAMLAVLKLHRAYVPLDPGFPPARNAFIVEDAGVDWVLSMSHLADRLAELKERAHVLFLDQVDDVVAAQPSERLTSEEVSGPEDDLCYVIYTSGTTGRPKGVPIRHRAICNFVRVAAEVYGYEASDRVYQGLTMAFDFSFEEIWVPWLAGATLIPKPGVDSLLGPELHAFLAEHRVTALCCVPTLLGTLDEDLQDLRLLLVSGEPCPADLVERWSRPGRRFLNVYGPTEATVSATWTLLEAGRPVRIGVPLPSYSIMILDPDEDRALDPSHTGEVAIAGIGLAEGYLGRPEATQKAFIDDFLGLPDNPSGLIYRTGDLGRVDEHGELEHLGRIDTQVKIRGYRIELGEIESVLRSAPGIKHAVVGTHQSQSGEAELAAYYVRDGAEVEADRVFALLREQLPPYMVPAYLERLDELPLSPSGKVDRKQLPSPSSEARVATADEHVEAEGEIEKTLAQELAELLGIERVSVESHFFEELGASSLLISRYSARLRRRLSDLPPVSIRQLYSNPTVRKLAQAISGEAAACEPDAPQWSDPELPEPVGRPLYVLCGALQVLAFLIYVTVAAWGLDLGSSWLVAGRGFEELYLRAVVVGTAFLVAAGGFPILAKWMLVGRFRAQRIRAWSLPYVRFWIVKTLLRANPATLLFRGAPALYGLYLRALGARVGAGAILMSQHPPICTDLIEIREGALIRRDTYLNGYRARDGMIEIGPVTIGADSFVGEHCVLDIFSRVGDRATLGHVSSVQAGQLVPEGEIWHGSPAQPADPGWEYRTVPPLPESRPRRVAFSTLLVLMLLLVAAPAEAALIAMLVTHPSFIVKLTTVDAVWIGAASVLAGFALAWALAGLLPRLTSRLLKPGRAYPMFGGHYALQRMINRFSNMPILTRLTGDSVLIDRYLRYLGWRFGMRIEDTGSNFGILVRQHVPSLTSVGVGTMVSDGLAVLNAEVSRTSFRVVPVEIGSRCFLGNSLVWPGGSRTGDNLLLGTKAMIPIGGEIRADTGLLGSPCFEIPRSVEGDEEFAQMAVGAEKSPRLRAKTRHNLVTMGLYLLSRFVLLTLLLVGAFAPWPGWLGTAGSELLDIVVVPLAVFIGSETVAGSRRLRPRTCPILVRHFWGVERLWKLEGGRYMHLFDGTPFKAIAWRLLGVRVGPRLFDDGGGISEKSLTTIGADVTLNLGAEIQNHSLENGMFKSDRIEIQSNCTVGVGALVHYGVRMGHGATLEADSFLMKGSEPEPESRWRGNPAAEVVKARPGVA